MNYRCIIAIGLLIVSGCESEPTYPVEPHIEFQSLKFIPSDILSDRLVLSFKFTDGDHDLGHDGTYPFHHQTYFLEKDFSLVPVYTDGSGLNEIILPDGQTGKLATVRTKEKPEFKDQMPPNEFPYTCRNYNYSVVHVQFEDEDIINDDAREIGWDSYYDMYEVYDQFYVEPNPDYNNIFVDFLIQQENGEFELLDWEMISPPECYPTFNGHFPDLSKYTENPIQDGTFEITKFSKQTGAFVYNLRSEGFQVLIKDAKFKLRFYIKDRALHTSNIVETPPGTLESFTH